MLYINHIIVHPIRQPINILIGRKSDFRLSVSTLNSSTRLPSTQIRHFFSKKNIIYKVYNIKWNIHTHTKNIRQSQFYDPTWQNSISKIDNVNVDIVFERQQHHNTNNKFVLLYLPFDEMKVLTTYHSQNVTKLVKFTSRTTSGRKFD